MTEDVGVSFLSSLATSCENMVSPHEQIMEKTRKFQRVYAGPTNLCQHSTTDLARGIMMNDLRCAVEGMQSFKQAQAAFWYSIYHPRAGKSSLFHMRGVDFTHFNTCYTFK